MSLNFTQFCLRDFVFENEVFDNKVFIKSDLITPTIDDSTFVKYTLDHLAMKTYLLILFSFNQKYGSIITSYSELYTLVNDNNPIENKRLYKLKFFTILLDTINWMYHDGIISFPYNQNPLDKTHFKDNIYIKLNKDKTTIPFDTQSRKFLENFVSIKVPEFDSILKYPNIQPMQRIKILYLFVYIKNKSLTYSTTNPKSKCKKFTFAKISYNTLCQKLGLHNNTITQYIKILSETVLIKKTTRAFIYTDKYGKSYTYGGSNLYIYTFDNYYDGVIKDVYMQDKINMDKFLEQNNYERSNVDE